MLPNFFLETNILELIRHFLTIFVIIAYYLTIIITIFLIILDNRHPGKTFSWILVIILIPVIGLLFYIFFGRNLRKHKLLDQKKQIGFHSINPDYYDRLFDNKYLDAITEETILEKHNVIKYLINHSRAALTRHNHIRILQNGEVAFFDILKALRKAKHHIHLEYYIIEEDKIGNQIKKILIQKARQGIEVRLIYDDVGSWKLSRSFKKELADAGIEIYPFMPVRFPLPTSNINYRNHRKIIVIDGKIGFAGGLNIADRYVNEKKRKDKMYWRDTHIRIEGEAVKSLQLVFLNDWIYASGKPIHLESSYFPDYLPHKKTWMQIISSGPDSESEFIMEAFFIAISRAKKKISICTPYFIPNESLLTALKTASLGGTEVNLLLPYRSDNRLVQYSSMSYFEELLKAGIKVFLYKKGFIHSKILLVDGVIASVGSANFDFRSFEQNLEVTAIIYDEEICRELEDSFNEDVQNSEAVRLEEWQNRKFINKIRESVLRMFAPLF